MGYLKQRFARVSSALLAAVYGPQVLSCIILGRLSDRCAPRMPTTPCNAPSGVEPDMCNRHGRKPVIVWSIAGSLLFTLAAGSTKTLWQVSDAPRASCLKSPSFYPENTLCERLVWPMYGQCMGCVSPIPSALRRCLYERWEVRWVDTRLWPMPWPAMC